MSDFDEIAILLPDPYRILWREKVTSTNDEIRILAGQGMSEGLVLIGEEQTAGRGRRGAAWFSPKGENLAFSVLLRPRAPKHLWSRFSLATGLAVAEGLERFLPMAAIKWPNDVLIDDRKIAGILVEAGADFVIIGIGINVNPEKFPDELLATSLKKECDREISRAEVLLEVLKRLAKYSGRIESDFEELLDGVRQRCALTGKQVKFLQGGNHRSGRVKGIGSSGELLVELNGSIEGIIQADEVRVCSADPVL
ncbi:biotin--[acetyl-CoA-carboxylase] ligase [Luteolibacter algae]|uniref:Biotin--[acetyl-CoA-carboxylase] ligase n=1 Tax=Luteolibacter algae TaxID=454151 RepID=A0ABW5DA05_9BACT